ncbi:MAG: hypothetical protein MZW92_36175 [Comamonadaceae bacterium]|nr:hypothetical protein [Comamonadaceae bacterium]
MLGHRIERLQQLLQARQTQLSALSALETELSARIAALDRTIELGFPVANPAAAGVVRAWAGRYGERGALAAFLLGDTQN